MTDKSQPVKLFQMENLLNCFRILIMSLGKFTWIHLRILMPLYIQPTNFKYSSVEQIISRLGVLMMPQGTFIRSTLRVLHSYFDAVN